MIRKVTSIAFNNIFCIGDNFQFQKFQNYGKT